MAAIPNKKFEKDAIKIQVLKTRDLDSESTKPKLNNEGPKPESSKLTKTETSPKEDTNPPKSKVKPPKTNQSDQ